MFDLNPKRLQHRDKQVAQGLILIVVKREVLAMNEHMMRELSRMKVEEWRREAVASEQVHAGRRKPSSPAHASLVRRLTHWRVPVRVLRHTAAGHLHR